MLANWLHDFAARRDDCVERGSHAVNHYADKKAGFSSR
jgi:hypothetical protein